MMSYASERHEAVELRRYAADMRAEALAEIAAKFAWGNDNAIPVGWDERDAKGI